MPTQANASAREHPSAPRIAVSARGKSAGLEPLLRAIPLFASANDKALRALARGSRQIDAPRAALIHASGERATGIYAVISGRVKLSLPAPHGGEKVIELLGAHDTFGQSAMFLEEAHIASAETLTQTRLVHVERAAVLTALSRDPEFSHHMLVALSRRLRQLIGEVASSTLHSGTERTVAFLLEQLPAEAEGRTTVLLPAKKRIIASRLDLTHEHFSRILRDLAGERLIVVEGPRVTITDVRKLRAYCEA